MIMWVWTVELTLSPAMVLQPSKVHDTELSFSFGQVRF